jgi:hypothetical protein
MAERVGKRRKGDSVDASVVDCAKRVSNGSTICSLSSSRDGRNIGGEQTMYDGEEPNPRQQESKEAVLVDHEKIPPAVLEVF